MDSQWLKIQFDLNPQKTKAGLAKAIGLEPPAISKILNGTRQIKAHEYAGMRKFFGLPVDGERALKPKNTFVLETLSSPNTFGDTSHHHADWIIPSSILAPRTTAPPEKIKIHIIQENLMEPDFKRGEPVVVDLSDQNPSPPGAFVVSDGFGFLVRHCEYIPASNPPEIRLSAKDPNFQPQTLKRKEFEILGRIIAKLQWT